MSSRPRRPPVRPSPSDQAVLRSNARDCFLKAAAALTESPTRDTMAFALLMGATGFLHLVMADTPSEAAYRQVAAYLAKFKVSEGDKE